MDVIVIGAGASGLVAAIYAAKQNNKVTILEKNKIVGKKLLLTGNGKCNYFNIDQSINHYHTSSTTDLKTIINEKNKQEILEFLDSIGIVPKIKNGYYYPASNQAISIQTALLKEATLSNVAIIYEEEVKDITKEKKYIIKTNKNIYQVDKVIVSTGSKACPKTGSDGVGYELLKKLGHKIIEPLPALVELIGEEKYFLDWAGIRSDVIVSLYENDKLIKKEIGEIQLTSRGVSGICIFQLSGFVSKGLEHQKQEHIKINFLPFLKEEFEIWLEKRNKLVKNRTISELLDGVLNYKLVNLILKLSKIDRQNKFYQLTKKDINTLKNYLLAFDLKINNTASFDKAQTCSGGIPLEEINLKTMESKIQKNLYMTGEIVDVNGDCGGYNLTFAFISGMIAGKEVNKYD